MFRVGFLSFNRVLFCAEDAADFHRRPRGPIALLLTRRGAHTSSWQQMSSCCHQDHRPDSAFAHPCLNSFPVVFSTPTQKNNWRCCRTLLIWRSRQPTRPCSNARCLTIRSQGSGSKMEWRSCQAIASKCPTSEGTRQGEIESFIHSTGIYCLNWVYFR